MKRCIILAATITAVCYAWVWAEDGHEDHEGHDHSAHAEESVADMREADHDGHDHTEHPPTDDSHDNHERHDEHPLSPEGSGAASEGHDDHGKHDGHDDHEGHEDEGVIRLDDATLKEFDIAFEVAGPALLNFGTTLPGEVQVNQDRQAHIVPRYPGLVLEVNKHIGDNVRKGDVLAVLEGNESLARYELKSLLDGTIIDKHISLGESLKEDDIVFIVADLNTVWIDLTVYQKDIYAVRKGQQVIISAGEHLPSAEGAISYVSPTVDEHTRTSLARVVLPNPDGVWRPGMFVTGSIALTRREPPVAVLQEAITSIEGRPSVFVRTVSGGVEPRSVMLGESDGVRVEILKGLSSGELYVSRNTLPLKAELNRAALEHAGHAH